jgi:hypothetical protein
MRILVLLLSLLPALLTGMNAQAKGCCDCYGRTNVYAGGGCDDPLADLQEAGRRTVCDCNRATGKDGKFKLPNPYRQPYVPNPSLKEQGLNCAQLQQAINDLDPLTYSFKPQPYADAINGASALGGTFVFWPLYLGMAWTTSVGYAEDGRVANAQNEIEKLRRLKAERHCFECRGGSACP